MARATRRQPSQSQRPANTQSQRAGPSRTQANRRARVESDDEAEEIPAQMDVDDDSDNAEGADGGEEDVSDLNGRFLLDIVFIAIVL